MVLSANARPLLSRSAILPVHLPASTSPKCRLAKWVVTHLPCSSSSCFFCLSFSSSSHYSSTSCPSSFLLLLPSNLPVAPPRHREAGMIHHVCGWAVNGDAQLRETALGGGGGQTMTRARNQGRSQCPVRNRPMCGCVGRWGGVWR